MKSGKLFDLAVGSPAHRAGLAVFENNRQLLLRKAHQVETFRYFPIPFAISGFLKPVQNIHAYSIQSAPCTMQLAGRPFYSELWRSLSASRLSSQRGTPGSRPNRNSVPFRINLFFVVAVMSRHGTKRGAWKMAKIGNIER